MYIKTLYLQVCTIILGVEHLMNTRHPVFIYICPLSYTYKIHYTYPLICTKWNINLHICTIILDSRHPMGLRPPVFIFIHMSSIMYKYTIHLHICTVILDSTAHHTHICLFVVGQFL